MEENARSDALWGSRCWYWRDQSEATRLPRAKNQRQPNPLFLSGFGVSFGIEGGTLRIRNGLTHYPQKQETYRFFRGDLALPERIILLDCSGSISLDVLSWMAEQGVSLIQLNWQGQIMCLSAPHGYSAIPFRAEWQRATREDHRLRMNFCNQLIIRKIESSITALEKSVRHSLARERAMETAYATLTRLDEKPARDVNELRGIEGTAAAAYFRAWNDLPVRWRRSRRPIPAEWRKIGIRRSGPFAIRNCDAHHPVQAMLNYAYTVLQTQIQIWVVAEGYDPTAGIMHESRPGSPAFLFDLMEPGRAQVDRKILDLIKVQEFDPADFVVRSDGVCRLNPEMAKRIVQLTLPCTPGPMIMS